MLPGNFLFLSKIRLTNLDESYRPMTRLRFYRGKYNTFGWKGRARAVYMVYDSFHGAPRRDCEAV
jgi:hypothetical protein